MIQCADGAGFPREAFPELRGGNSDRDVAIQAWTVCLPHFSHATLADGRKNFLRVEFGTGRERHTRIQLSLAESENG